MMISLKRERVSSSLLLPLFTAAVAADSMVIFNILTEQMDRKMLPCRKELCTRNNKIKSTPCRRLEWNDVGKNSNPNRISLLAKAIAIAQQLLALAMVMLDVFM